MAKGNEFFTALNSKKNVIKSEREIVFRGKLDSLYGWLAYVGSLALEAGKQDIAEDLACLGSLVLDMLKAGVDEKDMQIRCIWGMSEQEIREASHDVARYGIKHFLPTPADGALLCAVNLIRTEVRELECIAVDFYGSSRPGLVTMLNRMSSAVYIVMCRLKAVDSV